MRGGSGLLGRGTLEKCGSDVVVKCKNVVGTWLVSALFVDEGDEQKDRDQKEGRGAMVWEMGKKEDRHNCEQGD
ncbi:MAG TPA: hypothetical protein VNU92_14755 [Edaphobacter sp.]|nr:hypothetical protein [Edaphobacter sp.]